MSTENQEPSLGRMVFKIFIIVALFLPCWHYYRMIDDTTNQCNQFNFTLDTIDYSGSAAEIKEKIRSLRKNISSNQPAHIINMENQTLTILEEMWQYREDIEAGRKQYDEAHMNELHQKLDDIGSEFEKLNDQYFENHKYNPFVWGGLFLYTILN